MACRARRWALRGSCQASRRTWETGVGQESAPVQPCCPQAKPKLAGAVPTVSIAWFSGRSCRTGCKGKGAKSQNRWRYTARSRASARARFAQAPRLAGRQMQRKGCWPVARKVGRRAGIPAAIFSCLIQPVSPLVGFLQGQSRCATNSKAPPSTATRIRWRLPTAACPRPLRVAAPRIARRRTGQCGLAGIRGHPSAY